MLVHKPAFYESLPIDSNEYKDAYLDTIAMANEVRESFGIDVGVALGPHTVVWEKQIETLMIQCNLLKKLDLLTLILLFLVQDQERLLLKKN